MTPWRQNRSLTFYHGDAWLVLKELPSESVNCCVTSPPYYGLRDYEDEERQIGLEPTLDEYLDSVVNVFAEVYRVLTKDGTVFVNMGDTYAHRGRSGGGSPTGNPGYNRGNTRKAQKVISRVPAGMAEKSLLGVPWRLALAMQDSGWILRQDIIWHKPNPMPEPVKDRCTKAHEYIFLFAKSPKYYWDHEANREPVTYYGSRGKSSSGGRYQQNSDSLCQQDYTDRNRRSVWRMVPATAKGVHFAPYPEELVKRCILPGCPPGGTVLDPFLGTGTTAYVAMTNGCKAVGIDLHEPYLRQSWKRCEQGSLFS